MIRALFPITLILLGLSFSSHSVFAQPSPEEYERFPVLREAEQEQKKGNFRNSLKLYRYAYEKNMARVAIAPLIVDCYEKLGQKAEILAFLQTAVKENPFEVKLRTLLSDEYHAAGQSDKALLELEYAERLAKGDPDHNLRRANILKSTNKHEEAIKNYSTYIEQAKPAVFEAYLYRGQSHQALGRHELAEKDMRQAHQLKPFHFETLVSYIEVLRSLKKYSETEPLARQCLEVDPKSVKCWDLRGDMKFLGKRYSAAAEHYQSALKLAPDNYEIIAKLAKTYVMTSQFSLADKQFARMLKMKPADSDALREWVPTLLTRQDFAMASQVLKDYHALAPGDIWAAIEYGKLMSFVGSHDVAVGVMKKHLREVKSDQGRIMLAYFLFKNGENGRSLDQLDDVKNLPVARDFNMGIVYFKMKKWDKGIRHFDKVPADSPLFQRARLNAAVGLENSGNVTAALERLSGIDPTPDIKARVTSYMQYLGEVKTRNPAESFEGYLDWELPTL